MRVIGTAGHVDHGKSTLVQRMTGIDPDRWREEKERGLTIDLGFAWFDLASEETVGIVDVPGHRDFIENMLAGIGGIDAVLLVIAGDEGVMPQTREHLAIIDLMGIEQGLVVITKKDMIDDPEWLDLIELDIHDVLADTTLADAPMVRVSAKTGAGIDDLLVELGHLLDKLPPRTDYNQPRLPVDRVFTVEGFGTVVTGTLSGGTLHIGDTIEMQPLGFEGRIRGLQSYQQEIEVALPGSRVAINVTGINHDDIRRGDVLAYPGQLSSTQLIDVRFEHLADASRVLEHNTEVKFFSGASESIATVRLLGNETLPAGQAGWLQLRLRDAIPLTQRDRFILRIPSPAQTIGGGVVINPHPERRWKRFDEATLQQLQTLYEGSPSERVIQAADQDTPKKRSHLQKTTTFDDDTLHAAIEDALQDNRLIQIGDELYWAASRYQAIQNEMIKLITQYHDNFPLRLGISREELRRRLSIKQALLTELLNENDQVDVQGHLVKLASYTIQFTQQQKEAINTLEAQMVAQPTAPPSYKEASVIVGNDVLHALIDLGHIVQVAPDVIFSTGVYQDMIAAVLDLIDTHGEVDAKQVRDHLKTSRKYAIALLEYFDDAGITQRVGDIRIRGKHTGD